MTGSGSDDSAFVESESDATKMEYDTGGVPFYVALVWIVALVSFMAFMFIYALPDLSAWFGG